MSIIKEECSELINNIDFEQLRDKSVLVTGASGLIGSYITSCLTHLRESHNITTYAWIKNDIQPAFQDIFKDCVIIQGDICDSKSFDTLPKFDYIIHAAGYGQPGKFLENKIKTITLNTTSTINLFDRLKRGGGFLFISTSELYSGIDSQNIAEEEIGTTNTNHHRSCYIESKRCGEAICYSYKNTGANVKIIRLSLAYGPGTKAGDHRVLNALIEKGLKEKEIRLLDRGEAVRTYCYITNVIEMIWNILLFGGQVIYNVGGNSQITIRELAELIGQRLDKNVVLPETSEKISGSPKVVNISTKKYKDEFGDICFISLDEGIIKTIDWQKNIYENHIV